LTPGTFYRIIEHTADVGIEVEAPSIEGVFALSGRAMFDLMFGLESVGKQVTRDLSVTGEGADELMVAWLNELLYCYAVEGIIFSDFTDLKLDDRSFSAMGCGERFDPCKHQGGMEIKAATYHNLSIVKKGERWRARVIFDV
jgi:SHS2 domain-containing protein